MFDIQSQFPHGTPSQGKGRRLVLATAICVSMIASAGCANIDATDTSAKIAASSAPARVVTQIINNTCGEDSDEEGTESLSTGSVKGLSKVLNGFGVPYDEHADAFTLNPQPVSDDSDEANKERGIGYMGVEAHYPQELASGQSHSPDHPEQPVEPGNMFPNLTTEEEKYGIAMRWEYANPDLSGTAIDGYLPFLKDNNGHKQYVAVHNLKTDKWCICCPYDWGPALNLPTTGGGKYANGRIGGVSAAAADELGIPGGDGPENALTECWWVENSAQVKCGPVNDLGELTKKSSSSVSAESQSARVTVKVASTALDAISQAASENANENVAIAPANANSFHILSDAGSGHGDLPPDRVRYVVLHDSDCGTDDPEEMTVRWKGHDFLPHFIVGRSGVVTQCVPMDRIAHHAGVAVAGANDEFGVTQERDDGATEGDHAMDAWSVGIVLSHEADDDDYPKVQLNALDRLLAYIDASVGGEPEIITRGEWLSGHRSSILSGSGAGTVTDDDAMSEDPGALSQNVPSAEYEGTVMADVQTSDAGQNVDGNLPVAEYKQSRNHSNVSTVADAMRAADENECSDSKDDDDGDSGGPGIARKAVEISGSAVPNEPIHGGWDEVPSNPKLSTYVSEKNRVYPGVPGWADCGRCAATAVKASGADDSFPAHMNTAYQYQYMTNSPKWQRVGTMRSGDRPDEQCEPGDVLVTEGKGHIMIYVGNEAVKKKYPNSNANFFEGSLGLYYGWCYERKAHTGFQDYAIFRCVKPDNGGQDDGVSSSVRNAIVEYARKAIGCSYDYTPSGGVEGVSYNCSFLSTCAYKAAGLTIPSWQGHQNGDGSQSDAVRNAGHWTTNPAELKPGDLVFFGTDPYNTGHVGVSLGGDQMIDSSYDGVAQRTLSSSFVGGGWPFAQEPATTASKTGSESKASSKKERKASKDSSKSSGTDVRNRRLAMAAITFSWSRGAPPTPTELYQKVVNMTTAPDCRDDGKCCYCTVRAAIMWSGADASFPQANYQTADEYLEASPLWERVAGYQEVHPSHDDDFTSGLEPGDFAITSPTSSCEYTQLHRGYYAPRTGHVMMYVGSDLVQEIYDKNIKGTDGDVGRPDQGTCYVQSSYKQFPATLLNYDDTGRRYNFWRYVGDYDDTDKFDDFGLLDDFKGGSSGIEDGKRVNVSVSRA